MSAMGRASSPSSRARAGAPPAAPPSPDWPHPDPGDPALTETPQAPPSDVAQDALRVEVVAACRAMNARGINQGTAGNISIRNDRGFLITPTSLPYDVMSPGDVVQMYFDGSHEGARRPSSEWRFHRDILQARPDIDSVVHCHSPYATTLAIHHKEIPSFHYMTGVFGGATIRCARYATFGTQALSDAALEALDGRLGCLLGQHGQITLGRTMGQALALAIELEALSRLYVQALTLGEPPILDDAEMGRVIRQMRQMGYGQAPELEGVNDIARPRA